MRDGRSVGRAFGGNQLPGAEGSKAGWCVGYPYLCYWGRSSPLRGSRVVPWVYTCGSVCVLGVAHLVAWVSSTAAAAAAVSGSGSREQGAGKSTLAFPAWVPGPREAGGTPGGAWARARSAPRGRGERTASPPEVAGAGVGGRDPPPAGTQPRSFGSECPPALALASGFRPRQVSPHPRSRIECFRKFTHKYI